MRQALTGWQKWLSRFGIFLIGTVIYLVALLIVGLLVILVKMVWAAAI